MLPDLFANDITSLARSISVPDYKVSLQSNWKFAYLDNNKENNENEINKNADTIKEQKRNMKNSNNVDF